MNRIARLICMIEKMFNMDWPKEYEELNLKEQSEKLSRELDCICEMVELRKSYLELMKKADNLESNALELLEEVKNLKSITVVI